MFDSCTDLVKGFLEDDDGSRYGEDTNSCRNIIRIWLSLNNPSTMLVLSCKDLKIHTLPPLPDNVQTLICGNQHLVYIPESSLPKSLKELHCTNCPNLRRIPRLPDTIEVLNVYKTNIVRLPDLPRNIKSLQASDTKIRRMPRLFSGIEHVSISGTDIRTIPCIRLPDTLIVLNISNTNITRLPELGSRQGYLDISHTKIKIIPRFPFTMISLNIDGCTNLLMRYHNNGGSELRDYEKRWYKWHEKADSIKRIWARTRVLKYDIVRAVSEKLNRSSLSCYVKNERQ